MRDKFKPRVKHRSPLTLFTATLQESMRKQKLIDKMPPATVADWTVRVFQVGFLTQLGYASEAVNH
jgi:hypothetical protein